MLCYWAARLGILGLRFTRSELRFIFNGKAVGSMSNIRTPLRPTMPRYSEEPQRPSLGAFLVKKSWHDKLSQTLRIRETPLFHRSSVTQKKNISTCSLMLEIETLMNARTRLTVNINLSTESIHRNNRRWIFRRTPNSVSPAKRSSLE